MTCPDALGRHPVDPVGRSSTACALELLDPLVRFRERLEVTLLASAVDKDTDPPTGLASVVTKLGC